MKRSTKKMSKTFGLDRAETTIHLYLYARYLPHYIYKMGKLVGLVEKPPPEEIPPEIDEILDILAYKVTREMASAETSTYHGKIVTNQDAQKLVKVEEDVELTSLEKVIPYKLARDIVLENPQNLALLRCACRMLQEKPCEPLEVCMAVGDPLVSFLLEHHVLGARRIAQDEAIELLQAEHQRGHVHTAYFKDVTGGRFYAICNCCSCCCLGMQAWLKYRTPIVAPSGYVAAVGEECTGCGECVASCPFEAISIEETAVVDSEKCMGCGVCEGACEYDAIELALDPSKGEPLDIEKLIREESGRA